MALRQRRLFHLSRLFSSSSSGAAVPFLWTPPKEELGDVSTVEILSWGRGSSGQLGGGKEEIRFYPCPVASLRLPPGFLLSPSSGRLHNRDAAAAAAAVEVGISCGLFHSSLLVDGRFWNWGKGDGGRLGLGHEDPAFVPTLNPNLDEVRNIALGGIHSTALTRSGEVFTCLQGLGGFGALGHSVYHRELLPRLVEGTSMGKISHHVTSGAHTAAISDSGNSNYELGKGNNATDWRPKSIPSLQDTRIVQIASGRYHSLALSGQVTHPSKVCSLSSRTPVPFCLYFQHAGFFSSRSLLADVENMEPVSSPLTPVIGNDGQATKVSGPKTSTVQAIKKDIRQSPKKVNLVAKLVRGMRVEDALLQLQVLVKRAAKTVYQVIHSARANASHNHGLDPDKLIVAEAFVGKGVYLKRVSYHAKGRSGVMVRPKCRLTVVVRETTPEEEAKIAKLRVMNYKKLTRKEKQLVPHQLIEVTPRWSRKKNEEATTSS